MQPDKKEGRKGTYRQRFPKTFVPFYFWNSTCAHWRILSAHYRALCEASGTTRVGVIVSSSQYYPTATQPFLTISKTRPQYTSYLNNNRNKTQYHGKYCLESSSYCSGD